MGEGLTTSLRTWKTSSKLINFIKTQKTIDIFL